MKNKDLKKIIPKWANEIGHLRAKRAMIMAGIGYTTAIFLIKGTYQSEPKDRLTSLIYKALGDYINKQS